MKKVALFLIGFFPYCLMFEGFFMRVGVIETPLTTDDFPFVAAIPVVAYVAARLGLAYLLKKGDRAKYVLYARLLNIVQIPAHLFTVFFGSAFVLTSLAIIYAPAVIAEAIFSFYAGRISWAAIQWALEELFSIMFTLAFAAAFYLTGRVGRAAIQWALEEGLLTREEAYRESGRQYIPVMSVISAIKLKHTISLALYRKSKEDSP